MTYPGGNAGQTGEQVTFIYLPQNLLSSAIGSATYLKSATYDAAGRPKLFGLGSSGSSALLQTSYDYFAWTSQGGRLQFLKSGPPATPTSLQYFEYNYDAVGNLNWIKDYNAGGTQTQSFAYDNADRILSASASGGTGGTYSETYTYDGTTGNLASKTGLGTYTYNATHKHAVASVTGRSFQYDANGNMTQRVIGTSTYNLTYDAENHLTGVSGAATATFVYDGDGNRVKATVGGVTVAYVGNYYEWSGSTGTSYYYAGSLQVAMRQGGTLYYPFGDHPSLHSGQALGSTSVVASSSGSKSAEVRYRAWGEDRYTSGTAPTSFRYTGQRVETSLGLYFYGARWFDASLGRFLSPDSVVPDPYNPFDLDRYAYVRNNPLRYNDPTGHMCSDPEDPTPTCEAGGGSNKLERVNYGKDKDNLTEGGRKAYQYYQRARNNTGLLNNNKTGPITDLILQLPGSAENWSDLATGIDIMAWLTDIYATSVVTYAGIAGAALPAPLIAAGLPEVPMATGLAGMALAELYIQPVLFTGNALATISMGATIVADTKGGNTRIEEAKFSSNTANSMALTDVGWLSNEAYLSLTIQSIAVANDLQWSSLPFPVFP